MKIKGVKVYCCYSVPKSCPTLCNPMGCSTPGFPVHHQLLELAQTRVHRVSDAIQPSHPLSSPSLPVFSLSQHQGLFQGVSSTQRNMEEIKQSLAHGEHSACVGLYYRRRPIQATRHWTFISGTKPDTDNTGVDKTGFSYLSHNTYSLVGKAAWYNVCSRRGWEGRARPLTGLGIQESSTEIKLETELVGVLSGSWPLGLQLGWVIASPSWPDEEGKGYVPEES